MHTDFVVYYHSTYHHSDGRMVDENPCDMIYTECMSEHRCRYSSQVDMEATTLTNLFHVMVHGPTRENRRGRHPDSASRLPS